jgi:hypothetical protein
MADPHVIPALVERRGEFGRPNRGAVHVPGTGAFWCVCYVGASLGAEKPPRNRSHGVTTRGLSIKPRL